MITICQGHWTSQEGPYFARSQASLCGRAEATDHGRALAGRGQGRADAAVADLGLREEGPQGE